MRSTGEPADIGKPGWDPRGKVYSIVSANKTWEQVGETYRSVASPAGDKDGNVFFADPSANRIYKSDADRKVTLFKDNSNGARALRVGPDGRLPSQSAPGGPQFAGSPNSREAAETGTGAVRSLTRSATFIGRAEIGLMDDAGLAIDAGAFDNVVVKLVALLFGDERGHIG